MAVPDTYGCFSKISAVAVAVEDGSIGSIACGGGDIMCTPLTPSCDIT